MVQGAGSAKTVKKGKGDKSLNTAIWLVGILLIVVAAVFGGYYYYDRYMHQNVPLVERDLAHYEELVLKDPQNVGARVAIANIYMSKNLYDQAAAQFREALKIDSKHVGAQVGLGTALYKKGDKEGALQTFKKLITQYTDPDIARAAKELVDAHYYMGMIYSEENKLDDAEKEFKAVLSVDRTDADAIYQVGTIYFRQGAYDDAIDAYKSSLVFVPNFKEAYQGLVEAYGKKGETAEANYAAAMVDYSDKSYDAAAKKLQDVVKAKPDFTEAWIGLGLVDEDSGQKDKAIEAYRTALKLDSTHPLAKRGLIRLGAMKPE